MPSELPAPEPAPATGTLFALLALPVVGALVFAVAKERYDWILGCVLALILVAGLFYWRQRGDSNDESSSDGA